MIIIILFTIFLGYGIFIGSKYFEKQERIQKARENVEKRYRLSNGRFSDIRTYGQMRREFGLK